jgi:histidyl-tRNA synthetase
MKYANNKGHKFVIILGQNELENGIITLKNMINGEQQNIGSVDELIKAIKI